MAWWGQALLLLACLVAASRADVIEVTDDDSHQLREGEWMIKFYAPWCPACQQFAAPWLGLARKLKDSHPNVKIAKVDVTAQPIMGGRFMVQHLPTFFHAKDGEYRRYEGERSADALEEYIATKLWQKTDPIPSYLSPMGPWGWLMSRALVAGNHIQKLYFTLTRDHGMPSWLVIACGAVSVITAGVLVGLLLVCCISMFTRSSPEQLERVVYQQTESENFGSTGENDEVDRKKGGKSSPKPSPKASPAAAAVKTSPHSSSPRERKGKGKKIKASSN